MCSFSSIIISFSKFYATKPKARYLTFSEACDYASSHRSQNIIFRPPESGNVDQESDTENVSENFKSDDTLFAPTGELKVDDSSSSSDNENESE